MAPPASDFPEYYDRFRDHTPEPVPITRQNAERPTPSLWADDVEEMEVEYLSTAPTEPLPPPPSEWTKVSRQLRGRVQAATALIDEKENLIPVANRYKPLEPRRQRASSRSPDRRQVAFRLPPPDPPDWRPGRP